MDNAEIQYPPNNPQSVAAAEPPAPTNPVNPENAEQGELEVIICCAELPLGQSFLKRIAFCRLSLRILRKAFL